MYHKKCQKMVSLPPWDHPSVSAGTKSLTISEIWPQVTTSAAEGGGWGGGGIPQLWQGAEGLLTAGQVHHVAGLRHQGGHSLGRLNSSQLNLE